MKKTQKTKLINYLQTYLDFSKCRKTFADLLRDLFRSESCLQAVKLPRFAGGRLLNQGLRTQIEQL